MFAEFGPKLSGSGKKALGDLNPNYEEIADRIFMWLSKYVPLLRLDFESFVRRLILIYDEVNLKNKKFQVAFQIYGTAFMMKGSGRDPALTSADLYFPISKTSPIYTEVQTLIDDYMQKTMYQRP